MSEPPTQIVDDTPVTVNFTGSNERVLRAHDIASGQAAEVALLVGAKAKE